MNLQSSLPWDPLTRYAQLLGSPTVLGTSSSSGQSSGYNMNASYGKGK